MKFLCKEPGCAGTVEFDKDDTVVGNFLIKQLPDHQFVISISDAIPLNRSVGTLRIIQPGEAELGEQSVYFHRNEQGQIQLKDRFYLTCSLGHTSVYEIELHDQ